MTSEIATRGGASGSVITYRVGGREYPLKSSRLCKVCQSPYRFEIEQEIVAGRTYAKIVEHLPEDSEITYRNVKDHYYNGHLPLEVSTTRAIIEARAAQVGKRIDDATESLLDGISLAQVVVQKTFEDIASGRLSPEVKEGLAAAKMLADLGVYDDGGLDQMAITEAFIVYHESAQKTMTPEQFEAFGRLLSANPVLKALASRYDGDGTVPGDVVKESPE